MSTAVKVGSKKGKSKTGGETHVRINLGEKTSLVLFFFFSFPLCIVFYPNFWYHPQFWQNFPEKFCTQTLKRIELLSKLDLQI
jgi:hypothetical protein